MQFLNEIFSEEQVNTFRSYWNNRWQQDSYINWEVDGKVIDRRLSLPKTSKEFAMVAEVVHRYFSNPVDIWSAYQQQNFAHQIHIDDYGIERGYPCYTMIFSMDTVPQFKTIVWKEVAANNQVLHEHVQTWGDHRTQKLSNISELEDLEHTYDENQQDYFADYLHLDGIYTYKSGNGVLFNARQYHCTSNWLKYPEFSYRELLQVHVICKEPIEI
jgi:hypothetical protein